MKYYINFLKHLLYVGCFLIYLPLTAQIDVQLHHPCGGQENGSLDLSLEYAGMQDFFTFQWYEAATTTYTHPGSGEVSITVTNPFATALTTAEQYADYKFTLDNLDAGTYTLAAYSPEGCRALYYYTLENKPAPQVSPTCITPAPTELSMDITPILDNTEPIKVVWYFIKSGQEVYVGDGNPVQAEKPGTYVAYITQGDCTIAYNVQVPDCFVSEPKWQIDIVQPAITNFDPPEVSTGSITVSSLANLCYLSEENIHIEILGEDCVLSTENAPAGNIALIEVPIDKEQLAALGLLDNDPNNDKKYEFECCYEIKTDYLCNKPTKKCFDIYFCPGIDIDLSTNFKGDCTQGYGEIHLNYQTSLSGTPQITWASSTGNDFKIIDDYNIEITTAGVYEVTVDFGKGCSNTETIVIDATVPTNLGYSKLIYPDCTDGENVGAIVFDNISPPLEDGTTLVMVNEDLLPIGNGNIQDGAIIFDHLDAGTYNFLVEFTQQTGSGPIAGESAACQELLQFTVPAMSSLHDIFTFDANITHTCPLENTGAIQTLVSPTNEGDMDWLDVFYFHWTNAETGALISNNLNANHLPKGKYTLIAQSNINYGCQFEDKDLLTVEIVNISTIPEVNFSTQYNCTGGYTLTPQITGGNPDFDYEWIFNGQVISTSQTIQANYTGTITLHLVDDNNCNFYFEKAVKSYDALKLSGLIDKSCPYMSTGNISLTVSDGEPPYQVQWSTGANFTLYNNPSTSVLSDLSPGTYSVSVTDNKNCTKTATFTVTELALNALISSQNGCKEDFICPDNNQEIPQLTINHGTPIPDFDDPCYSPYYCIKCADGFEVNGSCRNADDTDYKDITDDGIIKKVTHTILYDPYLPGTHTYDFECSLDCEPVGNLVNQEVVVKCTEYTNETILKIPCNTTSCYYQEDEKFDYYDEENDEMVDVCTVISISYCSVYDTNDWEKYNLDQNSNNPVYIGYVSYGDCGGTYDYGDADPCSEEIIDFNKDKNFKKPFSNLPQIASENNVFSIFPNPSLSSEGITIYSSHTNLKHIYLYNTQGKLLTTLENLPAIQIIKINTASFAAGLYIAKVMDENNHIYTQKFMLK
ncbi:MAG: T9SS type A sorting domain-containing protein [Chitinophagales bacterium]|nr:T9SS type A sorting domain-containing protein [Bacteroidota bacterium]MCB9043676.1 T9SS type A sorting domain-containing protein [Chitinophagales bacterium]